MLFIGLTLERSAICYLIYIPFYSMLPSVLFRDIRIISSRHIYIPNIREETLFFVFHIMLSYGGRRNFQREKFRTLRNIMGLVHSIIDCAGGENLESE